MSFSDFQERSNYLFKKFLHKEDHLIASIQPLIAQIGYMSSSIDSSVSFSDITYEYGKTMIKNSKVACGLLDTDFKLLLFSAEWESWLKKNFNLTETDIKNIQGKNFFELMRSCPKQLVNAIKANTQGMSSYYKICEYKLPDNKKRWIRWESFPWYNKEYVPHGVFFFLEDITSIQNMMLVNKKLRACNELLEEFSMVFAHDLLQPMRQISNFMSLLAKHVEESGKNDSFIDYSITAVNQGIQQMHDIAQGMIVYFKKGDLKVKQQPVSVKKIIAQIQRLYFTGKKIKFIFDIDEDIVLYANPICILQLFQNLLANAIKYNTNNKPTITLSGKRLNRKFYQFYLRNKGECPSNILHEPFHMRADHSSLGGTGLGLMICERIISAYRGKIAINSSYEHGTEVSFSLPLYTTKAG